MLRRSVFAVGILLGLTLAACSALPGGGGQRTLSVTGTGSVSLPPDIVVVNIGVQTQSNNVAQAVAENNRRAGSVVEAVQAAGVAEADVRTTYFSVSPQQQYDPTGSPTGVVSYFVDNTISVTLRQIDALGSLLQAALNAGANSINGVQFGIDDPSQAQADARQLAMADAQARAETLAGAAGARLGEVLSISTIAPMTGDTYAMVEGIGGGGGVPISAGSTDVQVQVYVVYELK